MKFKRLLLELIDRIELFEATVPNAEEMGLDSFLSFMQMLELAEEQESPYRPRFSEVRLARHLSLLHRYSRMYIKRALSVSECLQSEEEYTYLVCLMGEKALTKTELHQRNGLEKTTGAEVLRRLARHGLIAETPDSRDKRSVLVSITPRGRAELQKVFPQLHLAASLLALPLEGRQQELFQCLLDKLIAEHSSLISELREESLEVCLSKLKQSSHLQS